MVKVFVRKSDNHVVGTADASRVDEEMQNILASELGGVASDYNVLDAPAVPLGSWQTPHWRLRRPTGHRLK